MSESTRPVRAFLAHVSEEGGRVAQVAKRLSRARIITDKTAFRPGDPLPDEIRRWLAGSDLFVLFATRESIQSTWVNFEMNEAEIRRLQGDARRLMVITTDTTETRRLLPEWLRTGLIEYAPTPARAAELIGIQIVALESGARPSTLFINRDSDLAELRGRLIPPMGSDVPRLMVIHGLRGIGRRTLLSRALRDSLSLEAGPILTLGPSDFLDWLHIELLQRTQEFNEQSELAPLIQSFEQKSDEDKAHELASLLADAATGNRAPIIVDDGLLMDESGAFKPEVAALLRAVSRVEDLYVAVVTPRAPKDLPSLPIVVHRVGPLDQQATRQLMTQALRRAGTDADPSDVAQLAPWARGYPPAAMLLADAVERYGMALTLSDTAALKDLTIRFFGPLLDRLNLGDLQLRTLRLLQPFGELPVAVIAVHLGVGEDQLAGLLKELVDLNLVVPGRLGIGLADPLRQTVLQKLGDLTESESSSIARELRTLFWPANTSELVPLEIVEAVSIAVARAAYFDSELSDFGVYQLPSTLMRMAAEAYDGKRWDAAVGYALRVLEHDPRREDAMTTAFKGYVRLEQWDNAEEMLSRITKRGMLRRFYLRGFMEWKRGQYQAAVGSFRQAITAGDRYLLVRHHLAYCLFLLDKPREALAVLENMPQRATNRNRFFMDLTAQVLIRLDRLDSAEQLVEEMKRYGFEADYWHRLAHIRLLQGRGDEALTAAKLAVSAAPHRNEARVLEAEALVALGDTEGARRRLTAIPVRSGHDKDVQHLLLARLSARTGDWRKAESHWRSVENKETSDSRRARREMIPQMLASEDLDAIAAKALASEHEELLAKQRDLDDLPIDHALDSGHW